MSIWAVIMAGGSGTRFWPTSRKAQPKQLTQIIGDSTMIQATVARLQPTIPAERVIIMTTAILADKTREQLPMVPAEQVVAEPVGRDTAPCVALAAKLIAHQDPDGVMVLLPADQVIEPAKRFQETLMAGVDQAASGGLVTYGITPRHPATGYGYVECGEAISQANGIESLQVASFKEKPDTETAKQYCASGNYLWNAGIFTWRADTVIQAMNKHCPSLMTDLAQLDQHFGQTSFADILNNVYPQLERISIDYALMEHADNIIVVRSDFTWDDVGSWDSLYAHIEPTNDAQVRTRGDVLVEQCEDCLLVQADGPTIAAVGLSGHTVVSTRDAVLIVPKGSSQQVKDLVERLAGQHDHLI